MKVRIIEAEEARVPFSTLLPVGLTNRLRVYVANSDTTITSAVEDAVKQYLDREGAIDLPTDIDTHPKRKVKDNPQA